MIRSAAPNLNVAVAHDAPELRERGSLIVEILTGQIRLDAMTLDALRVRHSEESLDDDLKGIIGGIHDQALGTNGGLLQRAPGSAPSD